MRLSVFFFCGLAILTAVGLGFFIAGSLFNTELTPVDLSSDRASLEIAFANLQAQQHMAVATVGILCLTGVGLCFIYSTLQQSRRAADAAWQVVEETKKMSEAQVRETRRIGEAQTRCYLVFKSLEFRWTNRNHPHISMIVSNTGNTPAQNVDISTHINLEAKDDLGNKGTTEYRYVELIPDIPGNTEQPIDIDCLSISFKDNRFNLPSTIAALERLELRIKLNCTDVFGQTISGDCRSWLPMSSNEPAKFLQHIPMVLDLVQHPTLDNWGTS